MLKMTPLKIKKSTTAAISLVAALGLCAMPTHAGTRSYSHIQNSAATVNIKGSGTSATSRSIILPYSKSTVIELPDNVMDVIVSNPEVVEAVVHTSRRTMLIGKSAGQANVYFYSHDGRELLNLDVRVERNIDGLSELISTNAPTSSVEVQSVNSNILLTGSVPNAAAADTVEKLARMWLNGGGTGQNGEIVNLLAIEGKDQVMLKVRIVEMQRSVTKQMGLNLSAIGELGESTVSLVNAVGPTVSGGLIADGTYNNTSGGDLSSLSGALSALETVGLVRTLAEPTLTAISGETANFLAGGEIPLFAGTQVDQTTGALTRSFEFKPFGVSLGFTPVVLSEGLISLSISTEVSEPTTENAFLSEGGESVLGIRVRRANTVVELPAGGSLVIAGLIREEARSSIDGTPGLKDVPGLGALFRGRDSNSTQTELVVIVTPYLVDPTHPDKLQTPADGFLQSNDTESVLMGRLNKVYAQNGQPEIQRNALTGPFGHVVD